MILLQYPQRGAGESSPEVGVIDQGSQRVTAAWPLHKSLSRGLVTTGTPDMAHDAGFLPVVRKGATYRGRDSRVQHYREECFTWADCVRSLAIIPESPVNIFS